MLLLTAAAAQRCRVIRVHGMNIMTKSYELALSGLDPCMVVVCTHISVSVRNIDQQTWWTVNRPSAHAYRGIGGELRCLT